MRRKAAVLRAVHVGEISIEQACEWYGLSAEEFRAWERDFELHGLVGLRSTLVQIYRNTKKE